MGPGHREVERGEKVIITQKERDWLEWVKRQTQRDVESGRLDAVEAYRKAQGKL